MLMEIELHDEWDVRRWSCADGQAHILTYRVMYGYRLRAGDIRTVYSYDVDWCMGDIAIGGPQCTWLRESLCRLIEANVSRGESLFADIPGCSRIKPLQNDPDFLQELVRQLERFYGRDSTQNHSMVMPGVQ